MNLGTLSAATAICQAMMPALPQLLSHIRIPYGTSPTYDVSAMAAANDE
jgi:hypothetical protein